MTGRIKGFTVTLDKDIRIDDVQPLLDAVKMLKGVIDVTPSVSNGDDYINRMQIETDLKKLKTLGSKALLDKRFSKFRSMGNQTIDMRKE